MPSLCNLYLQQYSFLYIHTFKAQGELIVWDSSRRPSVRGSTLSNMNISETSWLIVIKFHLDQHQWGGGLTALGEVYRRLYGCKFSFTEMHELVDNGFCVLILCNMHFLDLK